MWCFVGADAGHALPSPAACAQLRQSPMRSCQRHSVCRVLVNNAGGGCGLQLQCVARMRCDSTDQRHEGTAAGGARIESPRATLRRGMGWRSFSFVVSCHLDEPTAEARSLTVSVCVGLKQFIGDMGTTHRPIAVWASLFPFPQIFVGGFLAATRGVASPAALVFVTRVASFFIAGQVRALT